MVVDLQLHAYNPSIHTQYTKGGTKVKRTTKVDNTSVFYNDSEKDKVPFYL